MSHHLFTDPWVESPQCLTSTCTAHLNMLPVQSELVRIAAELEASLMAKTGRLGAASPIVAQSEDLQVRRAGISLAWCAHRSVLPAAEAGWGLLEMGR